MGVGGDDRGATFNALSRTDASRPRAWHEPHGDTSTTSKNQSYTEPSIAHHPARFLASAGLSVLS